MCRTFDASLLASDRTVDRICMQPEGISHPQPPIGTQTKHIIRVSTLARIYTVIPSHPHAVLTCLGIVEGDQEMNAISAEWQRERGEWNRAQDVLQGTYTQR